MGVAALEALAAATMGTPYEGELWLVGGAVRDPLLGLGEGTDFDIVLEHDAIELAGFLYAKGISTIHPVVYPRFGTALVQIAGSAVELITARRESYESRSRKPNVTPATLAEDALRRDFTCNALFKNLHTAEVRDPLGRGRADLEQRVLRTPRDPVETFHDDPLRMLRAVRFRWKLGFTPAPGLYESIRQEANRLAIISSERIRDEWVKMLIHPTAPEAMQDLMDLGLLNQFAPEFRAMVGVEQGKWHHLDVWDHTLLVLRNVQMHSESLTLALAALLHDVGKPLTRTVDASGQTRFFGHETVGAYMTVALMRRLKFSNTDIEPVWRLVKGHMRLGMSEGFTKAATRRLIRDMDGQVEDLLLLVEADAAALKPGVKQLDLAPIRAQIEQVSVATPRSTLESPLSGREIMAATGLSRGVEVGHLKQMLLDRVLDGTLAHDDKELALWLVREAQKA